MLYLQVYFTDVVVHVKAYLSNGQKMHLELVHFLLKSLEGKVMDLDVCGRGPTLVVTSVRELLLVMRCFLKKSVMAVCFVPWLGVGSSGRMGFVPVLLG